MVVGDRSLLVGWDRNHSKELKNTKEFLAHSTDRVHFKWIQIRISEVKLLLWQVVVQETGTQVSTIGDFALQYSYAQIQGLSDCVLFPV